jgi:hypothetical protein
VTSQFCDVHPVWREEVDQIAQRALALCEENDDELKLNLKWLREAYALFSSGR